MYSIAIIIPYNIDISPHLKTEKGVIIHLTLNDYV